MEQELKKYLDNGYLSLSKRHEYMVSKGIIRLIGQEPVIRADKGKEYLEMNESIDKFLHYHNKYGKSMSINSDILEKDVNKIDRSAISKLKQNLDDITADEIPL